MIPAKILFADFLKIHKGRSQQSGVMIQQNNQVESTLLDYKDTASGEITELCFYSSLLFKIITFFSSFTALNFKMIDVSILKIFQNFVLFQII